ncbi:RYamide receptor [Procambarus clarkii]|uniref:RYamide receptor n=1 Tax=Procambarus clarkii TaxID=6728 RepID=UPI003742DBE1
MLVDYVRQAKFISVNFSMEANSSVVGEGTTTLHLESFTLNRKPNSVEEILKRCDEEILSLLYRPNETELWLNERLLLPEYTHCEYCNISQEELDVLFYSGVCVPSDYAYMPLIYLVYASIFLLALLGNSLVLYTVASNRKMHTVTNLFIANLAVGDLLSMVFCVPFSVASIIVLQYWPFGEGLCIIVNYSQAISIFVSAYTLVAISLDRYLAIIYPLRPRMTRLQAKVIIALVWGLALFTTLPIAVFSGLDPTDMRIYQSSGREVCREQWPDEALRKYYTMALMVLHYFLPLVVLIFTYSRIAWKVWGCKPVTSRCSLKRHLTVIRDWSRPLEKSTSDHSPAKMIKMTLTVVLVYSLCWLPFNILLVVLDFVEEMSFWPHLHHLWFVFHWLAMSHTCYNPVILCWMNAKFREGFLNVLYHLVPCGRSRISQQLLKLRQSSGLQRAHTYSTAFGSSRNSRNQRFNDEPHNRLESSSSTTGFLHITSTTDVPLKLFRTRSLDPSTNGLRYTAVEREQKENHVGENDRSPNPTVADNNFGTCGQTSLGYLPLPHEKIDSYLYLSGESTL